MKIPNAIASQPIQTAIAAALVLGVVYFVLRRVVGDVGELGAAAARQAGGIVTGNNALTLGTPYADKGVIGTAAAVANRASGGALQSIGESLGGWLYDVTHRDYDPSTGYQSAPKTVSDGARATDDLWGRLGSVELRAN